VIHVKRGRDVEMDVVVTRHGPLISREMKGESRQLALKWAIYDTGLSLPFFAVNSAQNWEQFRAAFGRYNGPGQNVVYAMWMATLATRLQERFQSARRATDRSR